METATATFRGLKFFAMKRANEHRTTVTIRRLDYWIVAEFFVVSPSPKEAIRDVLREQGSSLFGLPWGYLDMADACDIVNEQFSHRV